MTVLTLAERQQAHDLDDPRFTAEPWSRDFSRENFARRACLYRWQTIHPADQGYGPPPVGDPDAIREWSARIIGDLPALLRSALAQFIHDRTRWVWPWIVNIGSPRWLENFLINLWVCMWP